MGILSDLRLRFREGNLLQKLLFINIGVFLLVRLTAVLFTLLEWDPSSWIAYLQLPSSVKLILWRPWTLITYMVLHYDFIHILFNMLWLYGFGQIFLSYFSERQMGGLYLLGGLGGALFYVVSYNLFPYFESVVGNSLLMGASASILAIVAAVAFYAPNVEVNLFIIGRVKLKWIALVTILIDILSVTSSNAGGNIAHLGGALIGYLFALQMRKGHDLTKQMNRLLDKMVNAFKPSPKIKVAARRSETDYQYNARKHQTEEEVNTILEKIKRSGYAGLTSDEKRKLFEAGKR